MIDRERLIIWGALIISIAIHLFILLPGLVEASSPEQKIEEEEYLLNKSEFKKQEEEEEEKLELGIDDSEASTLTWIGYKEYQEHMARLADVEQAELQAGSAMPLSGGAPAAPDRPEVTPQQPTEPTPETAQPSSEPSTTPAEQETPASNAPVEEQPIDSATGPKSTDKSDTPPPPGGLPKLPEGPAPPGETSIPLQGVESKQPDEALPESTSEEQTPPVANPKPSESPASEKQEPKPEATPQETKQTESKEPKPPVQPTPPVAPSKAGPGGTAGAGPPVPDSSPARDETDDKLPPKPDAAKSDSSATSTVKVPLKDWKKGKPIAASGLRLYPRRPTFTALQGVTAGGSKNLFVRFEFGSNGKPAKVTLVRGTGIMALDRTFTASFYQWRASGKQLKKLKKGERIPVQLEIVLTVN